MIIKTVKELKDELSKYDENRSIVFRKNEGDGWFSDYRVSINELYPEQLVITPFQPAESNDEVSNDPSR